MVNAFVLASQLRSIVHLRLEQTIIMCVTKDVCICDSGMMNLSQITLSVRNIVLRIMQMNA